MLQTGRSRNDTCMGWLKEIFWLGAKWDFEIVPEYIPTDENKLADALSRLGYTSYSNANRIAITEVELCCKDKLLCCLQVQNGKHYDLDATD